MSRFASCFAILFSACTCFAQMYTVTDLGTFGGAISSAAGINDAGQVVGWAETPMHHDLRAFRTSANSSINPIADELGSLGGYRTDPAAINNSGQVVGMSFRDTGGAHAYRTAANSPINPTTDDLGPNPLDSSFSFAKGINASGQVVGGFSTLENANIRAFRTTANGLIDPARDDLGTLGGGYTYASAINDSGVAVGGSTISDGYNSPGHAFRTGPNRAIDPATDDLGTLGGNFSSASGINALGQVAGDSTLIAGDDVPSHAFRTAANRPINPLTDDLGTLGGTWSSARAIDSYGQVIGMSTTLGDAFPEHSFLFSNGTMYDVNTLTSAASGCQIVEVVGINNAGQIAGNGICAGTTRAVRLDPIYEAYVQQPVNADGSSVFNAKRGVVPVKFKLTQYDLPTCPSLPATITVTRTAGGTLGAVDENTYSMSADSGLLFRIDSTAYQYVYNLPASSLGVGTYRVDISINGIMVGHAVFALK